MTTIPQGHYDIECVLIDTETVMNNEGLRGLQINPDSWYLRPAEQRFDVLRQDGRSAVLVSNGHTYYAQVDHLDERQLKISLTRENIQNTIMIEARKSCSMSA